MNRVRHLDTVSGCIRSSAAICVLSLSFAHANTIFDRIADLDDWADMPTS
jgi:hypothetical protein